MAYEIIERYIERLLQEGSPAAPIWNMEKIRQGQAPHWNYIDGCMMNSLWRLFVQTGDSRYMEFVDNFMDYYIDSDGAPLGYDIETYNLDNVCPGQILFELYEKTGKDKYKMAIELLRRQLSEQPRTREGNFWHKEIYPNQVWLDGLFMAQVFYTKYAISSNNTCIFDDILGQFEMVRKRMYVASKKLYCHGYDAERSVFWADRQTGRSKGFWLRAMGWFAVAMADIIELLGDFDSYRTRVISIFVEMIEGIASYSHKETGLYWQVVDKGGEEGNYLETSGSAMIAYAMLKGARLGVLNKTYREMGEKTFRGICQLYLKETETGLNLGGICLVAGLGPAANLRRNGTDAYYYSEPVVENDAKGVAPFIMCYTEIKKMQE